MVGSLPKARIVIPYGLDDYLFKDLKKTQPGEKSAIFTSNPMRGLEWLLDQWEKKYFLIQKELN